MSRGARSPGRTRKPTNTNPHHSARGIISSVGFSLAEAEFSLALGAFGLGGHYLGGGGTRRAGTFFAVRARIVSTSSLYCSISRCDGAIRSSG